MSIFKTIKRVVYFTTYSVMATPAIGMMAYAALNWEELNRPKEPVVEESQDDDGKRFLSLLKEVPETCGIPAEIVNVFYDKENAPWCKGMACVRLEEHHISEYGAKITSNKDHQRMWASS